MTSIHIPHYHTGTNVHGWLFNGLNQCYATGCAQSLTSQGVMEAAKFRAGAKSGFPPRKKLAIED